MPAAEGKEWSYIDKEGQIAIPSIACGHALPFADGLAMIRGPRQGRGRLHQSPPRVRLAFAEITKPGRNGLGRLLISMLVAWTNPT